LNEVNDEDVDYNAQNFFEEMLELAQCHMVDFQILDFQRLKKVAEQLKLNKIKKGDVTKTKEIQTLKD